VGPVLRQSGKYNTGFVEKFNPLCNSQKLWNSVNKCYTKFSAIT